MGSKFDNNILQMTFPINNIILDGARLEGKLDYAFDLNKNYKSLYHEDIFLNNVAPYIFPFKGDKFQDWYLQNGWSNSWGILIQSHFSFEETYKHLRRFLLLQTDSKEQLYFRFYDPRVLRIFLPTCDNKQLREFFGPIEYFICEDEDPSYGLIFSFSGNQLHTERRKFELLFELTNKVQDVIT
jgi:hypothetical protein